MTKIRFILSDQLSENIASLESFDFKHDIVVFCEIDAEFRNVPHHKQKIVFLLSAMRHFAETLREKGMRIDYVKLDDPQNTGTVAGEIARAVQRHAPERVVMVEPGDWRIRNAIEELATTLPCPLVMREDNRFICTRSQFEKWAVDRKTLRMEFFYREMRLHTGYLVAGGKPEGGAWNFDAENRNPLPANIQPPKALRFSPNPLTAELIKLVNERYSENFGDLSNFGWAVTASDAQLALTHFITHSLLKFGDFQDAMKTDEPYLFHSLLSPYINAGLLDPREVCQAAINAYNKGSAPLNAVEGFVRQIIGWREYVRGLYWHFMPNYEKSNALNATRPLPAFYWTGETKLNCLSQTIGDTKRNAYSHHIQRLMITGNFALLGGFLPAEVEEWYLAVYIDAYDWVELPNTHGMILFADGGLLASKPYAASGAYINRMSNYCKTCHYDVKQKTGPNACPFNYLYWNFLSENESILGKNMRLSMPYTNLKRMSDEQRQIISSDSQLFLDSLPPWYPAST
jgi:deoxyribodipyrimidine photolyase-related protein